MSSFVSKSSSWLNVDDSAEEVAVYLDVVSAVLDKIKRRSFAAMGLRTGAAVLDVGCGVGRDAEIMLGEVGAHGRVIGVDVSKDLISQANERTRQSKLRPEFVVGQAEALEFADNSFDASRTDRVLQHLDQPERAIAEMVRVTKPGGRVVVLEPDWHAVTITSGNIAVAQEVSRQVAFNLIKHGDIGRRVPGLLVDAGCQDLEVEVGVGVMRDLRTADYCLHFRPALDAIITAGVVTSDQGKAWWESLQELDRRGSFFASVNEVISSGRVP
jgi:ubiquinone/menaquinone biosynthesis C-methylase UbiE